MATIHKLIRRVRASVGRDAPAPSIWNKWNNLYSFEMSAREREWAQLCMYMEVMFKITDIPGDIAEFGVGSGISLLSFVRINEALQKDWDKLSKRQIYAFDSFQGLPKLTDHDQPSEGFNLPKQMHEGGYSGESALGQMARYVSEYPNVSLIKGWFSETVPPFLKNHQHVAFALVHIDCDLYESTRDSLGLVFERMAPGGIILFDELFHPAFPGETVGFWEVFNASSMAREFSIHRVSTMPWKKYLVRQL
jgi:hypothetical protein